MTTKYVMPKPEARTAVQWDGTNITELRDAITSRFTADGDAIIDVSTDGTTAIITLTVSGTESVVTMQPTEWAVLPSALMNALPTVITDADLAREYKDATSDDAVLPT
jgi:hypothetical protein